MAMFDFHYYDHFAFDFDKFASLPDDVIDGMLNAEADVIKKAQAKTARQMLQGPYNKRVVENALKLGRIKKTRDHKYMFVTFGGTQHGNEVSEIAFVNEYGKKGQPARPFIKAANEQHAEEAVDAAAKVYDQYLNKIGF